jgi:hypothetical protein
VVQTAAKAASSTPPVTPAVPPATPAAPVAQAVAKPVAETVAPVVETVAKPVVPVAQAVVKPVVEPVVPVAQAVVKPVVEPVVPVAQAVVKPVVEPVVPVAQAVVKPVVEPVVPVAQAVVKPVVEPVVPVAQAVVKPVVVETVVTVTQTVPKPVVETASRAARTVLVAPGVHSLTLTRSEAPRAEGSLTRAVSNAPTQTATFPEIVTTTAAGPTSDPESYNAESAPATQRFAHSASPGATSALHVHGQPFVWVTRSTRVHSEASATPHPVHSSATVSAPSPRGGSLHGGRTALIGLSNFLASITAVATGTASAGGGNGGGGLLPFAALAVFALMTPRLGRRLRLELATWPSSALVLSLERPG